MASDRSEPRVARLDDVLKVNGEEHLYEQIQQLAQDVDENPPMLFRWYTNKVDAFVQAIQTARTQATEPGGVPLPADPLDLPAVVNVQTVKEAVLEYVRIDGAPARLGTSCLPCSMVQCGHVSWWLCTLDADPWTQRVIAVGGPNVVPIASVYVPQPRPDTTKLECATPSLPNSLWGEQETTTT